MTDKPEHRVIWNQAHCSCVYRIDELNQEIERLRAALQDITGQRAEWWSRQKALEALGQESHERR